MKDKSFNAQMGQIVAQAEQERREEIRREQRHLLYCRVRKACLLVIGAAAVFAAYGYRSELGQRIDIVTQRITSPIKHSSPLDADAQLSQNLGEIQATAHKRDKIIDEIAGGAKK